MTCLAGLLIVASDDDGLSDEGSVLNVDVVSRGDRIFKGNFVAVLGSIFAAVFFMRFHS